MNERFLGEVVLPGVAHSVAVARHCVGEMLASAGHRDVENARLIVSELVTNALIHTASGLYGGVVTVEVVAVDAQIVRVEVTDDGADKFLACGCPAMTTVMGGVCGWSSRSR